MKVLRLILIILMAGCTMVSPTPTPGIPAATHTAVITPTAAPPPLFYIPYRPELRLGNNVSVADYVCQTLYMQYEVTQYSIVLQVDEKFPLCVAHVRDLKTQEELMDIIENGI